MKFCVLVVDFDGTIAVNDVLDRDVVSAIGELRARGILVVLATGRILQDLERVAGNLHFVDAVVAENGGVVLFPESGYLINSGPRPSPEFLRVLESEGIRHAAGRVLVDADANDAGRLLEVIRRLQLPLVLVFNRGRVMVMPQAISKATGVRSALAVLRLSPHNGVAIGDAENDHELLQACEVGVAVAWGSNALKAAADYVLPGEGPRAVSAYIRNLVNQIRLPIPMATRRSLVLGYRDDGQPLGLAIRGRNILVAGDPKSGKSWVTGLLCEQLILSGYSLCIIDPEGDYVSLEALPGVKAVGGADPLPRPRELIRSLRHADTSLVIDLSHASHEEKLAYVRTVLPALATLRRHTGLPHRIVLDEAHYFLHGRDGTALVDPEFGGYTIVSYRSSRLDPAVLASSQAVIVTRESHPAEVGALHDLCTACPGGKTRSDWDALLGGLALGEAAVLPLTQEACGEIVRIRLAPRLTPHVRHQAKYIDIPIQESREFVFWHDGLLTKQRARTLRDFVAIIERAPLSSLDGHLKRGDFSKWIAEVFGDYPLGKTVREIEENYRRDASGNAIPGIAMAIRARYEFLEQAAPLLAS